MKKYHSVLFILILLFISALFNQFKTNSFPPRSMHQWRQSDAYSITYNYYAEGMHFFEPKIHNQTSKEGKAVGEFPIIYYIDALIWKITGPSFYSARVLNLCIAFLGLFALFKTIQIVLNDYFFAYIIPILIFSSPLYGYYSNSFLINIPALSFLFIGWYYFLKFYNKKSSWLLILSIFFITLAGLLRPSMLIGFFPVFALLFFELIGYFKSSIFFKRIFQTALLLTPLIAIYGWMSFSKNYNAANNSIYFLSTIRPIWENENIPHVWSKLSFGMFSEWYHTSVRTIFCLIFLWLILNPKKQNKLALLFTLSIALELILYVLLWFSNFDVHDYYLIEFFILVPPLLICFLLYIKENHENIFYSKSIRAMTVVAICLSLFYGASKTRMKYDKKVFFLTEIFLSEEEIGYWKWFHWDYDTKSKAYEKVTPYLRSLGIKRTDNVVSVPDQSPNITLSLMDQKGFTTIYSSDENLQDYLPGFIKRGAKYLIVKDPIILENKKLATFTKEKLGTFRNIQIYKLPSSKEQN
jgi:general stress protein CsbA